MLLRASGSRYSLPPWPTEWVSIAHNNDYAGGGSVDNYLHAFTSADGVTWTALAANTKAASLDPSVGHRDPSLITWGGRWWIIATSTVDSTQIDLLSSVVLDTGWATVANPSTAAASPTASWAPQWFVDTGGSVHVLVSLQTSGTRKLYEMHPTNVAMTTWSDPVLIGGTGFATNTIDANLTYWDGVYYLLWKDDGAGLICLSTSTSPFSGYTAVHTGNWAGWGPGSIEGPKIVDIGTGWRVYFSQNSGFNANAVYYSETTDRTMATGWGARASIASFSGYNHPLPVKRP